jgi:hypothetical protein
MANNDVTITLRAQDGASNTFKQVGRVAQTTAKTINQVGTTSERALGHRSRPTCN